MKTAEDWRIGLLDGTYKNKADIANQNRAACMGYSSSESRLLTYESIRTEYSKRWLSCERTGSSYSG
jgi:hypothetical protein